MTTNSTWSESLLPVSRAAHAAPPEFAAREAAILASYAMHSLDSRGRRHPEGAAPSRSPYEIDRDRIVHSAAYRRLSHKLQVFTGEMGDYHRTRLTHTLEVASLARTVGRVLRLNEDLIEALALAHDLGHPPFGHAGEAVLNKCLAEVGGFCHNRHALRLVEELEVCDPRFPGLNLTYDVLAGQATRIAGEEPGQALLEAQVVEAADSIAYDTHDADDALKLGLIEPAELDEVALWRQAHERVRGRYADLDALELKQAILQELIVCQTTDLIDVSRRQLAQAGIATATEARAVGSLIGGSRAVAEQKAELERFLYVRVYRHPRVLGMCSEAVVMLEGVFDWFRELPHRLPKSFQTRLATDGLRRTVGDYVAGMTDRYVGQQHRLRAHTLLDKKPAAAPVITGVKDHWQIGPGLLK